MKRFSVFLCALFLVFGVVTSASAITIEFNYTADNVIGAWYQDGDAPMSLPLGEQAARWWKSDSYSSDAFLPGHTYQVIWQVVNEGEPSSDNPGGFLGEVLSAEPLDFGAYSALSSSAWEIARYSNTYPVESTFDFNSLSWQVATEYGANSDPTIWYQTEMGPPTKRANMPIGGISWDAEWIWTEENFGETNAPGPEESIFVKVQFTTPGAPVPEPATMLLLGAGLIGMAAFGRRKLINK